MSKSLYITTTKSRSGKSSIVLGIMQLLLRNLHKVGFFRPVINPIAEGQKDHDIDLVLSHFYLGLTYEELNLVDRLAARHADRRRRPD